MQYVLLGLYEWSSLLPLLGLDLSYKERELFSFPDYAMWFFSLHLLINQSSVIDKEKLFFK